jgi:hypothetical protein
LEILEEKVNIKNIFGWIFLQSYCVISIQRGALEAQKTDTELILCCVYISIWINEKATLNQKYTKEAIIKKITWTICNGYFVVELNVDILLLKMLKYGILFYNHKTGAI